MRWLVDGLLPARQRWGSKTSGTPDSPGRSRIPELTSAVARRQQRLPLPFPPEEPAQRSPAMTPTAAWKRTQGTRRSAHPDPSRTQGQLCRRAIRDASRPHNGRRAKRQRGTGGPHRPRRGSAQAQAMRRSARRSDPSHRSGSGDHAGGAFLHPSGDTCRTSRAGRTPRPRRCSERAPVEEIAQCGPPERRGEPHPSWAAAHPHKNHPDTPPRRLRPARRFLLPRRGAPRLLPIGATHTRRASGNQRTARICASRQPVSATETGRGTGQ